MRTHDARKQCGEDEAGDEPSQLIKAQVYTSQAFGAPIKVWIGTQAGFSGCRLRFQRVARI